MSRVLVTGGHGLIGSALVRRLLDEDREVVVLRRTPRPESALVRDGLEDRCVVEDADLLDRAATRELVSRHRPGLVVHLAGQSLLDVARQDPAPTYELNVMGAVALLDACVAADVERVVVASSYKAYGDHGSTSYHEELPFLPSDPYASSKASVDLIARSYWRTYGLRTAVTRLANVFGGGDLNRSRLVPEAVDAALAGRSPVVRSDGSPERDFLFVEDAVDAYLRIADALAPGGPGAGEAFNAGSGRSHSVLEVVELVCRAAGTGVRPDVQGTGTPGAEIDRQVVDPGKLQRLTGWAPRVGLEEGLQRTVDWHRERR